MNVNDDGPEIDNARAYEIRINALARAFVTAIAGFGVVATPFAILALDFYARLLKVDYPINQLILGGALTGVSLIMTCVWARGKR